MSTFGQFMHFRPALVSLSVYFVCVCQEQVIPQNAGDAAAVFLIKYSY